MQEQHKARKYSLPYVVRQARRSFLGYYFLSAAGIILAVVLYAPYRYIPAGIAFLPILIVEFKRLFSKMEIDADKVVMSKGLFNIERTLIYFHKLTDARVTQTLMQRIIGIGSLHLNTAGMREYEIVENNIAHPQRVHDVIEDQLKKHMHIMHALPAHETHYYSGQEHASQQVKHTGVMHQRMQ